MTLMDFQVTGSTPIEKGEYLSVSFKLINSNDGDTPLGKNGVFLAVKDPDGVERIVGCCYQNHTMQPDESISFETTLYLDKTGSWSIWSSYELKLYDPIKGWYKKVGPKYWHAYNFTVETPDKPDLAVEYIRLEPSKPVVGDNVTLLVGVKNIGTKEAVDCTGRILIDSNTTLYVDIPKLDASEHIELESHWIPSEPGIHEISFLVDCYQKVDEIRESNNYLSINTTVAPRGVDLEAYQIQVSPKTLMVGGNATIRPFIRNIGVNRSIKCNGTIYIDDEILCNFSISPIKPNVVYGDISIHWTPREIGVHQIKLWVDSNMIIPEKNEENNYLAIMVNVTGEDHIPPRVNVSYTPSIVTEKDNVTFHVEAFDENGVEYVSIVVYSQPSMLHFGLTDNMNTSFNYTCGPFQRGDTVYYYVESRDNAGNRYRSPTYNFTVVSYYSGNLTVDIYIEPSNPTELDEIMIYAEANYPYGVREISIINYKYNHTLARRENTSSISFGPIGPFTSGTQLSYQAKAVDVDGHIAYSRVLNITIEEVGVYNTKNIGAYTNGMVFLVPDTDWRTILTLAPISIWREYNDSILSNPIFNRHVIREEFYRYGTICIPTLVYHYEDNNSIDINPIINFFNNRWNPTKVVIVGDPPDRLLEKLVAAKPVGAGLSDYQIEVIRVDVREEEDELNIRVPPSEIQAIQRGIHNRIGLNISITGNNRLSNRSNLISLSDNSLWGLVSRHWSRINKIVITEDEYSTALVAAEYASLIDAPLLFQDHYELDNIHGKRVYLIGNFSEWEIDEIERYAHVEAHWSLEELQQNLIAAGAENIVLINPLDQWVGVDQPSRILGLHKFYYKQSLLAPFLAVAKKSVIVEVPTLSYTEIDAMLQEFIDNHFHGSKPSIIILASPASIPMARPNYPSHPEIRGNNIYFEVFNYNDIDIKELDLEYDHLFGFSQEGNQYYPFSTENEIGCIDAGKGLKGVFDILPHPGTEKASFPEGGTKYVVFQNHSKETKHDICILDISSEKVYSIANTSLEECKPDISMDDNTVVWQQIDKTNSEADWDISYIFIFTQNNEIKILPQYKHIIERDGDQINPCIYGDYIVYQDNRNGNWDIYMYNLSTGVETQITVDENEQILPRIYGDIIVWQDNRNGNWDIYMYNLLTKREQRITSSPNLEVRPNLNDRWIVWYEATSDGLWHLWAYNISTGIKKEVATTEVSHGDTKLLYLQVDDRFYASRDNNGYMDYPTGRVFGLTTSDLSTYIATDILFDKINKSREVLIIARGLSENDSKDKLTNYVNSFWTNDVREEFEGYALYKTYKGVKENHSEIIRKFRTAYLTVFYDHGWTKGLAGFISSFDLINIENYSRVPSILLNAGCLTAAYYSTDDKHLLFVTHVLRSGRIACLGFVDLGVASWRGNTLICDGHGLNPTILNKVFIQGKTIGEAFQEGKNCCGCGSDVVILLGDPTIKPRWWN